MEYLAPVSASNIHQRRLSAALLAFLIINDPFLTFVFLLYPPYVTTLTLLDKLGSVSVFLQIVKSIGLLQRRGRDGLRPAS